MDNNDKKNVTWKELFPDGNFSSDYFKNLNDKQKKDLAKKIKKKEGSDDEYEYVPPEGDKHDIPKDQLKSFLEIKKKFGETESVKTGNSYSSFSEIGDYPSKYNLLGKTLVYRMAQFIYYCENEKSKIEDEKGFTKALMDIFTKDDKESLSLISSIDEKMSIDAAKMAIKSAKEAKDKGSENYEIKDITKKQVKEIKKNFEERYDSSYKKLKNSLENGMEEQRKLERSEEPREFIDPVTGEKVKRTGKLGTNGPQSFINNNEKLKSLTSAIQSQKINVFNIGPKMILGLFSAYATGEKWFRNLVDDIHKKKKNLVNNARNVKYDDVKKTVDDVKKSTKEKPPENEDELNKFNDVTIAKLEKYVYDATIYLYAKILEINYMQHGINDYHLGEFDNNKMTVDLTNTENGGLTLIQDKVELMKKVLNLTRESYNEIIESERCKKVIKKFKCDVNYYDLGFEYENYDKLNMYLNNVGVTPFEKASKLIVLLPGLKILSLNKKPISDWKSCIDEIYTKINEITIEQLKSPLKVENEDDIPKGAFRGTEIKGTETDEDKKEFIKNSCSDAAEFVEKILTSNVDDWTSNYIDFENNMKRLSSAQIELINKSENADKIKSLDEYKAINSNSEIDYIIKVFANVKLLNPNLKESLKLSYIPLFESDKTDSIREYVKNIITYIKVTLLPKDLSTNIYTESLDSFIKTYNKFKGKFIDIVFANAKGMLNNTNTKNFKEFDETAYDVFAAGNQEKIDLIILISSTLSLMESLSKNRGGKEVDIERDKDAEAKDKKDIEDAENGLDLVSQKISSNESLIDILNRIIKENK